MIAISQDRQRELCDTVRPPRGMTDERKKGKEKKLSVTKHQKSGSKFNLQSQTKIDQKMVQRDQKNRESLKFEQVK